MQQIVSKYVNKFDKKYSKIRYFNSHQNLQYFV